MLDKINTIIKGNNIQILKQFDDDCIDLIITSPPYFQQRDYGNGKLGIGNESTENAYLKNLLKVFKECVRVTKKQVQ